LALPNESNAYANHSFLCTIEIREAILVDAPVRLRTGFYETTPYRIRSTCEEVVLSPCDFESEKKIITIRPDVVVSVSFLRKRNPELEIETEIETYRCILNPDTDIAQLLSSIENALDAKVVVRPA